MDLLITFAILIILMFILFVTGLPIAFSMALIGFLGLAYTSGFKVALFMATTDIYDVFSSYTLTVVPLFILMGQVAINTGIAKRLYNSSYKLIGHIPGGLALATILGVVLFKAICGSMPATVATFATMAVPEMDRYNYDKKLSCGTVVSAGTLGLILPPSVALIIYGIICNQSIAKLFLAGIIPGLLLALSFTLTVLIWCKINPKMGPRGEERVPWRHRFGLFLTILPIIFIFLLVIGGMMQGYFTATEAGSMGTFTVLILVLIKKELNLKKFITSVLDAIATSCMVLFILAGAIILGRFFTITKISFFLADYLIGLQLPGELVIFIIVLVYLTGGQFVEDFAFLVMVTPIFLPVVQKLGFDPVWFGIVIMVAVMVGMVIPPIAGSVFVVSAITKVPLGTVYKGVYPFLVGMVICLIIIVLFPQISLWLPSQFIK